MIISHFLPHVKIISARLLVNFHGLVSSKMMQLVHTDVALGLLMPRTFKTRSCFSVPLRRVSGVEINSMLSISQWKANDVGQVAGPCRFNAVAK